MENDPHIDPHMAYRAMLARDARFDGRFFTAVKTTGIYCRPVCPARPPKFENCRFMPSAAAAQAAGFRPCLRCRPETAPDLGAWNGTSNTVTRALRLIEAGALDGGDVEALADRLGVGERQLRRLFRQHLGASPVAVAQTARVLLAKQLIHDTELSMAQVAFASGFGSVRRFNETFQALYQRPPAALRRHRAAAVTGSAPGSAITLHLRYRAPYDWPAMCAVQGGRNGHVRRDIALAGDSGCIDVSQAKGSDALVVTIDFPRLDALPQIIARLRRMFDLAADPQAIGTALAADAMLAPLIAARPGLRVASGWDDAESPGDRLDPTDPILLHRFGADIEARTAHWRPWRGYACAWLATRPEGMTDELAA